MGQANVSSLLNDNKDDITSKVVNIVQQEVLGQSQQLVLAAICTYDEFLSRIDEINQLSSKVTSQSGKRLVFAVKRGTDETVLWKATVRIALICVDAATSEILSQRLLTLPQFLKIFSTIQTQFISAMPSTSQEHPESPSLDEMDSLSPCNLGSMKRELTFSMFLNKVDEMAETKEELTECCICLERKPDVLLPCAHAYCLPCIERWNNVKKSCPICRETLQTTDDAWVISDVPGSEDISQEICSNLLKFASQH